MSLSALRRHALRAFAIFSSARSSLSTSVTENNFLNLRTCQRTHTCGELRKSDVGKFVTLCGWLYSTRLSCAFLLLKDAYGITQVLVDENLRKSIPPNDSVIKVEGEVRLRPKKGINPAMTTGSIEVQARNIEVLGPVSAAVPFLMKDMTPISEHLGLKYRYLHLRRPEFQRNLRFRSTFLLMLRKYLCEKEGFVDLETPYLFRRTPGGAKEFIVPSQIRGRFYSLPQSPQQFKQLLMIGCFDRYMQIARCFRDELARPDRQPEFTQLDIEASFVEKDDIYRIVESTLSYAWSALQEFQLDSSPLAIPFQRMSYDEAMRRFGTDKPDTRFGLELWDTENNGTCPHMVCLTVPSLYVDEISQSFMERMRQEVKEKTGQEVSVLHPKDLSPTSAHLRDCLALAKDELLLFVEGDSPLERKTIGAARTIIGHHLHSRGLPIYKPGFSFLWVENFPLFSRNADGKRHPQSSNPTLPPTVTLPGSSYSERGTGNQLAAEFTSSRRALSFCLY